jgi:phage shock protein A
VSRGRDDLAREALLEKRRYSERVGRLEQELTEMNGLVDQYQEDIRQLEDKLRAAEKSSAPHPAAHSCGQEAASPGGYPPH